MSTFPSTTPYNKAQHFDTGPIVVQGQAVAVAQCGQDDVGVGKEQHRLAAQGGGCRDAVWAVLFYAHLGVLATLTAIFTPQVANTALANYNGGNNNDNERRALEEDDSFFSTQDISIEPRALLWLTAVAGIFACILSSLAMGFMLRYAETLLKTALVLNIVLTLVMALTSLLTGMLPGALMGFVLCGFAAYYAYRVWKRVPFAAVHLVTAITAVQEHTCGLVLCAYFSLFLLLAWTAWWTIASVSTILVVHECDAGDGECQHELHSTPLFFLFLVSYYWTAQILTNVVHVTVAGTVGSWWWRVPDAATASVQQGCGGCASSSSSSAVVYGSYRRAWTTSFGSICLGSLVVALLQAIRKVLQTMREQGDDAGVLLCVADCLLGCIESLVEYFNKWAFVYVGLYGSSFMESGRSVMTLFQQRGWTSIITDLMVDTVLSLVGVGVGAITGLLAVVLGAAFGLSSATWISAGLLGFALGYGMSSVLFSVVSSAVNTVVVCYAEAPNEFQTNHPELANRMRGAWREAFPNDFNY